jgi:hypothetical protein
MRRRRYVVAPAVLAVLVLLAVLGAQLRSESPHRQSPRPIPAAPTVARDVPTVLLAHKTPAGKVDLAVVVGVALDGRDASILLVPTLTAAETPSFDLQLIADQVNLGAPQLLHTTLENLLGVGIDQTAVLDTPTLLGVLTAAGPLDVTLRDPVDVPGGNSQGRSFPAGAQQLTPSDAATLLTTSARSGELDHLVAVQAIFEGWMRSLKATPVAGASTARVPELATLVAAAQASTKFSSLPVDAVAGEVGERYQVRTDVLRPAMQAAFPGRLLGMGGRRVRVEILNGTGAAGLAQQVAAVVVPAGGQVVKTGNAPAFGRPFTQVIYYRDENKAPAAGLLAAIGAGRVLKEPTDIGVFDITIIVGADFKSAPGT